MQWQATPGERRLCSDTSCKSHSLSIPQIYSIWAGPAQLTNPWLFFFCYYTCTRLGVYHLRFLWFHFSSPSTVSSGQSLSRVQLFATPWIAARQASLSITNSQSLLKLMPIESVMPSSHLILCCPILLLPPIPPSIRVFSNESALRMRWPKYWSFSFSISSSNEHPQPISFKMDWLDLLAIQGLSRVFSNTILQKHQFFRAQISSQSNSHIHTWPLKKP